MPLLFLFLFLLVYIQTLLTKQVNHKPMKISMTIAKSFPFLFLFLFLSTSSTSSILFPDEALPTKSGYLPITTTTSSPSNSSSSMFFAFYEAQHSLTPLLLTPLILWLQGGPGCSSMLANFFELGPFLVSPNNSTLLLLPNHSSWNRLFGLLFLDNPIGSGFSIATSPSAIPRDQDAVSAHLYAALQAFLSSDPSFGSRPFYIAGESYAGKYVPALAYRILVRQKKHGEGERINLCGVAIGNGLTHPVTQVATHADTAYFSGLLNERQRDRLKELQDVAVRLTEEEKWAEATTARIKVLNWLQNLTRLATLYDLTKKRPYESDNVGVFLNKEEVKAALGVPKELVWEECSEVVDSAMHEDVMKSVKFMVEEVVREVRVLLYQGIFDLRDGVVSTEAWVREMEWEGLEMFLEAEREAWDVVEGEVAGYVQRWGALTNVVVSGAGHLVPADEGASAQAMIEGWILEEGIFSRRGDEKLPCSR